MTPERFWTAVVLFHLAVLIATWRVASKWDPDRCRQSGVVWTATLARELLVLAVFTYIASLLATVIANVGYDGRRVHIGPISLRLLGQAIFAEAVLFAAWLAITHWQANRLRAGVLAALAVVVFAVNVDAYFIEPQMLTTRRHTVDASGGAPNARTLRILHITDIQTPSIGTREEHALRTGLSYGPDLIVLTGDYVQDALGRRTEQQAAHDLRELMKRIGFDAPLGVFATDGDTGPPCREVFKDTVVRCLVDTSARVDLAGGGTLGITGLSRGRGRERSPRLLAGLLSAGPGADHRIVISHAPDFVDALPVTVDLVLAGHTHGGQVVVPFFGPPKTAIRLPRRYAGGLNDYRGIPLHVSRGVGMERGFDIPVRFLCPPEICVLDFRLPPAGRYTSSRERKSWAAIGHASWGRENKR
jgi:predicted MPP superfamily phosphohydrolase